MSPHQKEILLGGVAAVVLILSSYGVLRYYFLAKELQLTKKDLFATNNYLQDTVKSLQSQLAFEKETNDNLHGNLVAEQTRNDNFEQKINGITNTVGTLVKLSNTDKELLQKYSKVYFLNENYVPTKLSSINKDYVLNKLQNYEFHADALPFLNHLLRDAHDQNDKLLIASAYRSFDTQESLKTSYKVTYGAGTANSFSADQGYSEHQLGTAIDFITTGMNGSLTTAFESTPEFKWLNDNAYKYGFSLSYPKGNAYYQYEPWHWRFVGIDLATRLHDQNKHFYDLDQRDITTYLANIFDEKS